MTRVINEYARAIPNGMEYTYDFYDGDRFFADVRFEAIVGCLFVHPNMIQYKAQDFKLFKKTVYGIGKAIADDLGYKHFIFYTPNPRLIKLFGNTTMKQIGSFLDYGVYQQDVH